MSTKIDSNYVRYYSSLGGTARSGVSGTGVNEVTLLDSTNATTSQVTLKNVATPTVNFDAVNKAYVDNIVGGTDMQVQYNDNGAFGADGSLTYNKSYTTPVLSVGGSATGLTTINLGAGSQPSTIAGIATGLFTISSAGDLTVNNTSTMSIGANSTSINIGSGVAATTTTIDTETINVGNFATSISLNANSASGIVDISGTTAQFTGGSVSINGIELASPGVINMTTSNAATTDFLGGAINIITGTGNGIGDGGAIALTTGSGGDTANGGIITITAGNGGATSGAGGAVNIFGGDAAGTDSDGGNVSLYAGTRTGTGINGNVVLTTGGPNSNISSTANIISFNTTSGTAARMEADGKFYATAYQTISDVTHKTNIQRIENPLERIKRVEGYSYNWRPEFIGYSDSLEYGVTAQQLEASGFGTLVRGKQDGEKTVNYIGLIPFLIEAIKELSEKLEKLEQSTILL